MPQPDGPMNAVTVRGSISMRDALDGEEVAVVDVQVVDFDALGHAGLPSVRRQRPVFGREDRATMRAMRLKMTTRMTSSSAAPQPAPMRGGDVLAGEL